MAPRRARDAATLPNRGTCAHSRCAVQPAGERRGAAPVARHLLHQNARVSLGELAWQRRVLPNRRPVLGALAMRLFRLSVPVFRFSVPLFRLSVPVFRLSVPLFRLSVPLFRLSVPVFRLSVPLFRLSVPLFAAVDRAAHEVPTDNQGCPAADAPVALGAGWHWPAAGWHWPMAGWHWPVAGWHWPMAGWHWPVAGWHWPMARRHWPVAG
jgi:hypothetical protein